MKLQLEILGELHYRAPFLSVETSSWETKGPNASVLFSAVETQGGVLNLCLLSKYCNKWTFLVKDVGSGHKMFLRFL